MNKKVLVSYADHALKDLKRLDKNTSLKIVLKIKEYSALKDPLANAKPLSGLFDGLWRFRIGDYRAIFQIDMSGRTSILTILKIKHRKDAYIV